MKYVLSLGAGVCSTGLLLYLHENKYSLDLVIHADTGEERDSNWNSQNSSTGDFVGNRSKTGD